MAMRVYKWLDEEGEVKNTHLTSQHERHVKSIKQIFKSIATGRKDKSKNDETEAVNNKLLSNSETQTEVDVCGPPFC